MRLSAGFLGRRDSVQLLPASGFGPLQKQAALSDAALNRHLFVYGTLRRDLQYAMHDVLARAAQCVGDASVRGALFDLGAYPGLVVDAPEAGFVRGALYAFHAGTAEQTLAVLDAYEGCTSSDIPPHAYRRALIQVALADGPTVSAWAYLLNRPPTGLTRIPGGDYVAWRTRTATDEF